MADIQSLDKTPLFDLHSELGGKMVPFAGYAMPVQYPTGILTEHQHTRSHAGLFDVSHMGQAKIRARDGGDPAAALETLMPGALRVLKPGRMRYSLLLNDEGGIEDDLMVTRMLDAEGSLYVVVNAACKDKDYDLLEERLGDRITLEPMEDHALLALQGPAAVAVLSEIAADVADLKFMQATMVTLEGAVCWVSRSGYTGEDGFEISVPAHAADGLARRLLADDRVLPIGLGARDSLRLEAGLCLSGHDFNAAVSPVEAGLSFAIGKKRREDGGFAGDRRILRELAGGAERRLVGLRLAGRAPAREGAVIADPDGNEIGVVTSGGFAPTLGAPIAMGFVPPAFAGDGTAVALMVRGKALDATVCAMPFVPHTYVR